MTSKEHREEIMSDEDRLKRWQAKGKRCQYCYGARPIETITDRLLGCCFKCAEWDNNAQIVVKSLPCICCGKQLQPSLMDEDEGITVNNVARQPFSSGMAGNIDAGYGSRHDTDVFMIAVCDDCIETKRNEGRLTFVYSYMPSVDGTPKHC